MLGKITYIYFTIQITKYKILDLFYTMLFFCLRSLQFNKNLKLSDGCSISYGEREDVKGGNVTGKGKVEKKEIFQLNG
jgi:hypothetical protein